MAITNKTKKKTDFENRKTSKISFGRELKTASRIGKAEMGLKVAKMSATMFILFFFSFCLFRAIPVANGGSQARGQFRAIAASLCHSHSNTRSKFHLQPTPKLMATLDP